MFVYCGNNSVTRVDTQGTFWETVFDVISLFASIKDVYEHPNDIWSWLGLIGDIVDLIPVVSCVGETVRAAKTIDKAVDAVDDVHDIIKTVDNAKDIVKAADSLDDVADTVKVIEKVHGNSLKSTKKAIGYALKKEATHEIMKFGETTRGLLRYTKKFYKANKVYMEFLAEGSKYDMHYWQHKMILDYTEKHGVRPPWNKTNW